MKLYSNIKYYSPLNFIIHKVDALHSLTEKECLCPTPSGTMFSMNKILLHESTIVEINSIMFPIVFHHNYFLYITNNVICPFCVQNLIKI